MLLRSGRIVIVTASILSLVWILHLLEIIPSRSSWEKIRTQFGPSPRPESKDPSEIKEDDLLTVQKPVDVVIAKTKGQDTSWLPQNFPEWGHKIYSVDDDSTPLKVPSNKGHESMVYLTYIIDNYDQLPEFIFFIHAGRFQWHNDDLDFDQYAILKKIRLDYVREQGYASLRCVWHIGCPHEIQPAKDVNLTDKPTSQAFLPAFKEIFPMKEIPELVSVTCCAQFVVTRERIHTHPKEDYIGYRDWVLTTSLDDGVSGRVFEYLWHIVFGKDAVHCPDMSNCYCKLFGICGLSCNHENCEGQWHFPPGLALPEGWPKVGWNGEERNFTGPL